MTEVRAVQHQATKPQEPEMTHRIMAATVATLGFAALTALGLVLGKGLNLPKDLLIKIGAAGTGAVTASLVAGGYRGLKEFAKGAPEIKAVPGVLESTRSDDEELPADHEAIQASYL